MYVQSKKRKSALLHEFDMSSGAGRKLGVFPKETWCCITWRMNFRGPQTNATKMLAFAKMPMTSPNCFIASRNDSRRRIFIMVFRVSWSFCIQTAVSRTSLSVTNWKSCRSFAVSLFLKFARITSKDSSAVLILGHRTPLSFSGVMRSYRTLS